MIEQKNTPSWKNPSSNPTLPLAYSDMTSLCEA